MCLLAKYCWKLFERDQLWFQLTIVQFGLYQLLRVTSSIVLEAAVGGL